MRTKDHDEEERAKRIENASLKALGKTDYFLMKNGKVNFVPIDSRAQDREKSKRKKRYRSVAEPIDVDLRNNKLQELRQFTFRHRMPSTSKHHQSRSLMSSFDHHPKLVTDRVLHTQELLEANRNRQKRVLDAIRLNQKTDSQYMNTPNTFASRGHDRSIRQYFHLNTGV